MRISSCSCHVAANGSYFDFDDSGKRSNGPITCMCASIAPSGMVKVSGRGLGSCLTYGSVVICGISHKSFGATTDRQGALHPSRRELNCDTPTGSTLLG